MTRSSPHTPIEPDDVDMPPSASPPALVGAPPPALAPEDVDELRAQARSLVRDLGEAHGSRELQLADALAGVGVQAQRRASADLDLFRGRMKHLLKADGTQSQLWTSMTELRTALARIDPDELSRDRHGGWLGLARFRRSLPRLKLLERIALRHETVSREVERIEVKLRDGQLLLVRDNAELRQLFEQVEAEQAAVRKNAYLGELILRELDALIQRTTDPRKQERLRGAMHDVASRVQDLRTMEEAQSQFFVSIELTHANNARLGQAVERALALGSNVVSVGLAIQVALARQKRVLEATQRTREFLGEVIVANAAAINRHTAEIGDVYNSPVIALDKITQAHHDLLEAIETTARIQEEGIQTARANIARLSELTGELQARSQSLRAPAEESIAIEA